MSENTPAKISLYKVEFPTETFDAIANNFFEKNVSPISKEIQKGHDYILTEILKEQLGREPIDEDFKLCTIATYFDKPNERHVAFKGKGLGVILTVFPDMTNQFSGKITFYPYKNQTNEKQENKKDESHSEKTC